MQNLQEPAGTCRNLRNLSELAGTCRNLRNLPELAEPAGTVGTFGLWSLFYVPLATSRRLFFHTDLPFSPQPPAPLQPTGGKQLMFALFGRNFAGTLPELAGTFLPELLLSPPPQTRNQTLLLSKLSSLSELAGTCRTCRDLPELFLVFTCEKILVKTTVCKLEYLSESSMAVPSHDITNPLLCCY